MCLHNCFLLIVIALLHMGTSLDATPALNISNANVTFQCKCENATTAAADQNTYSCDCETYLVSGDESRRCFYDCNSGGENYTCQVNEICERIVTCNNTCHHNATCEYRNGTYECVCDKGFSGNGRVCQQQCNGCNGIGCSELEPKFNCSCENKSYCCTTNSTCPVDCPNCKEEDCFSNRNVTDVNGNRLFCWCNKTCGRADGNFTVWSRWSNCSKFCGVGTQNRTRNCTYPNPMNKGKECNGNFSETQSCNITKCPTIGFSGHMYNASEKDGKAEIQVQVISGKVVKNVNISFSQDNAGSTAERGRDYVLPTNPVTFTSDGPKTKNISIELVKDYLIEKEEYFSIMFTVTDEDVTVALNKTTVFIEDSDVAEVYFQRNNYSVAEDTRAVNVTVILHGNLSIPLSASLKTVNGTAVANSDYISLVDKNITFEPNGSKSIDVQINIKDDDLIEENETFSVILSSLSSPKLAVKEPNLTVITILNDDVAKVNFERNNYSVAETTLNVTVILHGDLAVPVNASLKTVNGTADANSDYTSLVDEIITFKPDGSKSIDVQINIEDDNLVEENETFSVILSSLSSPKLAVKEPNLTVITILNDDVDGNFTNWSEWSNCSRGCGVGIQERKRTCTQPEPKGGGQNCTGNSTETKPCNITLTCPGTYNCTSLWSNWTSCNVSCGTGYRSRNRTWYNVVSDISCNGTTTELKECNMSACQKVPGNFSLWSNWTSCNETCWRSRKRTCLNTTVTMECNGTKMEFQKCNSTLCKEPENKTYSPWSNWTSCNETCWRSRNRTCLNTTVTIECNGSKMEFQKCNSTLCKGWSSWGKCNASCGEGFRTRQCSDRAGYGCNGKLNETKNCTGLSPCPVDGYFSEWESWGKCSQTCGSGVTSRNRSCNEPKHGGKNCSGETWEKSPCTNPNLCPDEIGFLPWSEWSECNVRCLHGIQTRTRSCRPGATNVTCQANTIGNKSCEAGPCPIPGNWSVWESWSGCPGICGSGFVNRTRKCDNPFPKYGGANCTGTPIQVKECNHSELCEGERGFTQWSEWTPCSVTCGNGKEKRTRECQYNTPHDECKKDDSQEKLCYHGPCPVNGEWSPWQRWSRCSSSCDSGIRERKRTCSNPKPSNDGLPCYGKDTDHIQCVMPDNCEDDYAYTNWGSWNDCNATTCGYGARRRQRQCTLIPDYPPTKELLCVSPSKDYQYITCFKQPCPIDGNFTNWSFWSLCSVTCGKGVRRRTRSCTHPPPSYGGADCTGKILDVEDCPKENISCPDDYLYETWGSWLNCSSTCQGRTERKRECKFENCTGSLNATKECNTQLCDVHGSWSEWTLWSSCDLEKCGPQQERRSRSCDNPRPQAAGKDCIGENEENEPCNERDPDSCTTEIPPAGWTDWSWWKPCSKSCNGGVTSRHRKCTNPPPRPGGSNCFGNFTEEEICNLHRCPINGNFSEWSPWTNCTESCGGGTRTRNRTCDEPKPQYGGLVCDGPNFANESCNVQKCPIHGGLTPWSGFSFCSKPCNHGRSVRTRSCTNPPPQYGGRNCSCNNTKGIFSFPNCTDHLNETKTCNVFVCPPVKVSVNFTFDNARMNFSNLNSDDFKAHMRDHIVRPYRQANELNPVVGFPSCSSNNNNGIFTCVVSVSYNFSDGDQLPILRDTLDEQTGSNISLLWMKSSVVFSSEVNITAAVLSSTSIIVNWTIAISNFENVTSITVFYKILDGTISFDSMPVPATAQGGVVLKNLKKYTRYKITVSATTTNGTGIPSKFVTRRTKEDVPSRAPYMQVISPNPNSLYVNWSHIEEKYLHGVRRGFCLFRDGDQTMNITRLNKTIQNLRPYTKHNIQVAAQTTPGCGAKSEKKSFFTLEDKPDAPPQSVTACNESSTSLRVAWKEVNKTSKNGIILGYRITYSGMDKAINITSATIFDTLISKLSVWTWYNVTVAAYTKVGLGPAAPVKARTEEGTPTVAPEISAHHTSSSSIYIEWNATTEQGYGNLLGYQITYTPYNNEDMQPSKKSSVKRVSSTTTNYTLTNLYYFWRYQIKIGGYTRTGVGKNATTTVRTDEHLPGRSPENVHAIVESSTSFFIYWDEVVSNFVHGILLGYKLEIQKTNSNSAPQPFYVNATSRKTSTYYFNKAQKYTKYTIWVKAVNSKGAGKLNSPEGYQVRTKEDAPDAPPSNIRVTSLASISTLNLEWERIPEEKANGIIRGYYVEYTATNLNGLDISSEKRQKKVFRVRGNRYATILENLIPGSTYEIRMFGYTIKNGTKSSSVTGKTCKCPEYLKVNWWEIPPYTTGNALDPGGIFYRTVEMMLEMCETCPNGHGKTKACYSSGCDQQSSRRRRAVDTFQQEGLQQVLDNIKDGVDISFPIQGNKYLTHYGGVHPYISVVENSGSAYFTVKKIPSTSHVLINATFYSIPMLLLFFLLSVLAGFIIWILERSTNPTSFPLSFTEGLRQGFWWAFISASTVGYGDRRPVTIPGRLFAITWILVGYVIITLLTSLMVSSITSIIVTEKTSIYGAKVAAIQNSTEYGKAIRQNGKVQPFSNVDKVIQALKDKVVDGAMLDMYAAAVRKDLFQSGEIQLRRQIEYPSGYGIVLSGRMKDSAPMINKYFEAKANELSLLIQAETDIVTQKQNQVQEAAEKKSGLFDATSEAYQLSMIVIISLLSASLAGGLFWQYKYHARAVKVQKTLQNSTRGYGCYKYLREDLRDSCEKHFKELMTKLKEVKKRHIKELKLLAKYHKNSGGPVFQRFTPASSIGSFARIRKMTASVTPSLNSHHNIALEVLDLEREQEKQRSKDSQV